MQRRAVLGGAVVVLAVVAIGVAVIGPGDFFVPEESETRNDTLSGFDPGSNTTNDRTADGTSTDAGNASSFSGTSNSSGTDGPTVLRSGTFTGDAGHDVSGRVYLLRDEKGLVLQFENYSQQQGPDVYIYVTPARTPDEQSEIDAGRKVLIDGGEDGGESTLEGNFFQRLPDDVEAENINGVSAWCDQFSTPFGHAALTNESA